MFFVAVLGSSDSRTVQVPPTKYEWNTENDTEEMLIDDEEVTESIGTYYYYFMLYIALFCTAGSLTITMNCSILIMAHAVSGTLTFSKSSFSFIPKDPVEISSYVCNLCSRLAMDNIP